MYYGGAINTQRLHYLGINLGIKKNLSKSKSIFIFTHYNEQLTEERKFNRRYYLFNHIINPKNTTQWKQIVVGIIKQLKHLNINYEIYLFTRYAISITHEPF